MIFFYIHIIVMEDRGLNHWDSWSQWDFNAIRFEYLSKEKLWARWVPVFVSIYNCEWTCDLDSTKVMKVNNSRKNGSYQVCQIPIHWEDLEKGKTINSQYYTELLICLKGKVKYKLQKLTKKKNFVSP